MINDNIEVNKIDSVIFGSDSATLNSERDEPVLSASAKMKAVAILKVIEQQIDKQSLSNNQQVLFK